MVETDTRLKRLDDGQLQTLDIPWVFHTAMIWWKKKRIHTKGKTSFTFVRGGKKQNNEVDCKTLLELQGKYSEKHLEWV